MNLQKFRRNSIEGEILIICVEKKLNWNIFILTTRDKYKDTFKEHLKGTRKI